MEYISFGVIPVGTPQSLGQISLTVLLEDDPVNCVRLFDFPNISGDFVGSSIGNAQLFTFILVIVFVLVNGT